jgi:hypothetical protein
VEKTISLSKNFLKTVSNNLLTKNYVTVTLLRKNHSSRMDETSKPIRQKNLLAFKKKAG